MKLDQDTTQILTERVVNEDSSQVIEKTVNSNAISTDQLISYYQDLMTVNNWWFTIVITFLITALFSLTAFIAIRWRSMVKSIAKGSAKKIAEQVAHEKAKKISDEFIDSKKFRNKVKQEIEGHIDPAVFDEIYNKIETHANDLSQKELQNMRFVIGHSNMVYNILMKQKDTSIIDKADFFMANLGMAAYLDFEKQFNYSLSRFRPILREANKSELTYLDQKTEQLAITFQNDANFQNQEIENLMKELRLEIGNLLEKKED